jgi:putative multiple sugar transport system substrate-binding protein
MQITKRALLALTAAATLLGAPVFAQDKGTVGISMPTKSSSRWISDGNSMVEQFQAAGYAADLQYAEDDIPTQLAQVENMISKGVNVLVVAAIDGTTLSNALANAQASGIKVIAYDRLIRDSGDVDYYTTFDNFKVGVLQANALVACLKANFPDAKPWNVELFGGSPDDNNAFFFYDGAMSVLQPMIDAGEIAVPSGQMGMDKVGTLRWDGAVAQARMDNLLSANYGDKVLNGALSPYDGLSIGILSSVKGVGLWLGRPEDALRHRPGRRNPVGQVDHRGRAELDRVQGHPDPGRRDREDGGRDPVGRRARDQRHLDLQQRREGRAVLPAGAGGRGHHELQGCPDRFGLLHRRPAEVS